ncbi:hypothetical protein BX600DRAFT_453557 [Xylariales sp. PMI_506]|nr:hypothetical protein BX600DRAFT_453557 [Xylariales sp. PMI_506]
MHSVRRAVLRAASSSALAASTAPRLQLASTTWQFSKAAAARPATTTLARSFSQTLRVADDALSSDVEPRTEGNVPPSSLQESSTGRSESATDVFVHNLAFDATEEYLREAFTKYGEIKSVHVAKNERGLSRGFGFVSFVDPKACDDAIEQCHQTFWFGRRISVYRRKYDNPLNGPSKEEAIKPKNQPTRYLFIGNIPYSASDADLNNLFRTVDNVLAVRIAVDRTTGWPRGFAHADFTDVESAKAALEKLGNVTLGKRRLRIDYAQGREGFRKNGETSELTLDN